MLVRWATDTYTFDESQVTGTVELVTDSKFEVDQVSIQGFPRQIPDGDPNRFPSLVVPGPAFLGAYVNEVKQLSLGILLTLDIINLFVQMYTHLRMSLSLISFKGLPLMLPLREHL